MDAHGQWFSRTLSIAQVGNDRDTSQKRNTNRYEKHNDSLKIPYRILTKWLGRFNVMVESSNARARSKFCSRTLSIVAKSETTETRVRDTCFQKRATQIAHSQRGGRYARDQKIPNAGTRARRTLSTFFGNGGNGGVRAMGIANHDESSARVSLSLGSSTRARRAAGPERTYDELSTPAPRAFRIKERIFVFWPFSLSLETGTFTINKEDHTVSASAPRN